MEHDQDAFYVVRKGDVIGVYTSFADCQAQVASSPLDPSISVYKGYGLSEEAKSYLVLRGLKQAGVSIGAADVQDGLFGVLSVCPFQDPGYSSLSVKQAVKLENFVASCPDVPASVGEPATYGRIPHQLKVGAGSNSFLTSPQQRPIELKDYTQNLPVARHSSIATGSSLHIGDPQHRASDIKNYMNAQQQVHRTCQSCTIEFDGASKGNPGLAGAGALLRATDGSEVWRLREGVGIATNNVAEYRSVILGLKTALQKGYKHVKVRGDSLLVCNQIQGKWKTKNENMATLCKAALELKKQFVTFTIEHVPREYNSDADAQANRAINLRDGQVEIENGGR